MHSNKKLGFTIAELMVVMTIIGVIVIFELSILQGRTNQYGAAYYNTYNALRKASYNILADIYHTSAPRPFPQTSQELCERLTELINVAQDDSSGSAAVVKNCSATDISDNANELVFPAKFDTQAKKDAEKAYRRFTALNGYRFYISGLKKFKFITNEELKYFIVYVDLNGEVGPNRVNMQQGDKIYPDIVPFAITQRGETIPMGYPIYSNVYMTAKVKLPGNTAREERFSKSMSFYEAVLGAWGTGYSNVRMDIPFAITFNNELKNTSKAKFFKDSIPSSKIKSSEITASEPTFKDDGCQAGTYYCGVVIDTYKDRRY